MKKGKFKRLEVVGLLLGSHCNICLITSIALDEALGIIFAKSVPELLGNLIQIKLACCISLTFISC